MQVFNYAWCRNILLEIGETKIQKTMTDYSKRCEGPATYGVLMLSPYVYNFLFCIRMGVTLFQDVVCYQP